MNATAAEVARRLHISAARVSQLTKDGTLGGCFTGEGRGRRYDLAKVANKLNKSLDRGQSLGNGRRRKQAAEAILKEQGELPTNSEPDAGDTYEVHQTAFAKERARKAARENAEYDDRFVLASEVAAQVRSALAQEIEQFASVEADQAQAIADEFGLNPREVRRIMRDISRSARAKRQSALEAGAQEATRTKEEEAADF